MNSLYLTTDIEIEFPRVVAKFIDLLYCCAKTSILKSLNFIVHNQGFLYRCKYSIKAQTRRPSLIIPDTRLCDHYNYFT